MWFFQTFIIGMCTHPLMKGKRFSIPLNHLQYLGTQNSILKNYDHI